MGLHFFNPVPIMKLVEVIRTIATDRSVYEEVTAFAARLGKTAVRTSDRTGFIVNRLLVPYLLDAVRALEEGVASDSGYRPSHEAGLRTSHGTADAARFRGAGHDVLHRQYYVRRIQGAALRSAAAAETHGDGGVERAEIRAGLLRIQRPGKSQADVASKWSDNAEHRAEPACPIRI